MPTPPSSSLPRRPKWHHPPPPPTPRILHFPRRPRRRPSSAAPRPTSRDLKPTKLQTLFDVDQQQRACAPPTVPIVLLDHGDQRREKVESFESESGGGGLGLRLGLDLEEDKWKFQAEMLRAECNLLRMEKEIALNKLERTRANLETTLRSAVHTLVSGRLKICEGKNVDMVLDEEIHQLTEKLRKLQKRSGAKDSVAAGNTRNFDKQVSVLQRRLDKIGGSSHLREFQVSIKRSSKFDDSVVARGKLNVEILRRKMEGLSKGILLKRMEEEYNSQLSTASTSLASSASTSNRVEFQDSSASIPAPHQEKQFCEGNLCSGHCKTIVRRIVEQVRAETEQWSQMKEMLGQVREEMEELQASRDFWEDRALNSDFQIQSLHNAVQEWRQRAVSSESKIHELEAKISALYGDLERLRKEQNAVQGTKCSPIPLDTQNELEKRIVVCCSKENSNVTENGKHNEVLRNGEGKAYAARGGFLAAKRSPLRDIGNSSFLMRQNGQAAFPLHCHLSSNVEKTY